MQSQDGLGPCRHGSNGFDVEIGGVGGEDGIGAGNGVEVAEHGLLQGQVLGHRLDDQVGMSQ